MKLLTADHVKLGFIGLGNMGKRIAQRLLDHGYQLSVYDLNPTKAENHRCKGRRRCKEYSRTGRQCGCDSLLLDQRRSSAEGLYRA